VLYNADYARQNPPLMRLLFRLTVSIKLDIEATPTELSIFQASARRIIPTPTGAVSKFKVAAPQTL